MNKTQFFFKYYIKTFQLSPAPLYGPISPITPAGTLATGFEDCYESALEPLRDRFGVEHLSECAEPKLFEYPVFLSIQ